MYKINVHSVVDLITNSSTTIYTFSSGCVGPVRELVNEMLKVMNSDHLTFDDLFYAGVFLDDESAYQEYFEYGFDDEEYSEEVFPHENDREGMNAIDYTKKIIKAVLHGEIQKPRWMVRVDENAEDSDNYRDTTLYLDPKQEIFQPLADKLIRFLYSTNHEESTN